MATNSDHQTQKITISKKTVKVSNQRDEEYPRAVKKDGKYVLPWATDKQAPDGFTNFKYFFTIDESKVPNEKKLDEEPLMQRMAADPNRIDNPPEHGIRTTWLGHSSALFQLDHVNILVNPNFNQRGIKYYHPGDNKRYRQPVYKVEDLPRIDCVFITNTHFDYLDLASVRLLNDRFGEMLLWYVPMGVADWMAKAGCATVVELDWWKEDEVDFIDHTKIDDDESQNVTTFNIACTPSQSYHSRAFDDDNAVLWCSWVIISPRYKLFISGATGYNDKIFKTIGRRFGPFHMAAIPIGGYHPDWKFGYGNVTPEEAVQIHQDVLAMCSLALSWGTFSVSNEYYLEPPKRLNEEIQKQGLSEMQFFLLKHGESRLVEIKEADKSENGEAGEAEHLTNGDLVNGHVTLNGHVDVEKSDSDTEVHAHVEVEQHSHVEIEGDKQVHVEVTTTTTETHVVANNDDDDAESTHSSHHSETQQDIDDKILQQLVDDFVDETHTTPVEADAHADAHAEANIEGGAHIDINVNLGF